MAVFRVALALFLLAHATSTVGAAEISFLCTDALAPSMRELVPEFEKASGHHVQTTVANAGTIAARLQSGQLADLGIVLPPAWDRLRQDGRIDPAVSIVLGKVGLGAFVRRGADRPDIGTVDAFKRTILNAKTIALRDPAQGSPVGTYMLALFDRLMLSEEIKPKLMLTTHPPYEEVMRGEADLGFSTLTEIAAEPRAEVVGPLPREIQTYIVFTVAIPIGNGQLQTSFCVSWLPSLRRPRCDRTASILIDAAASAQVRSGRARSSNCDRGPLFPVANFVLRLRHRVIQ